MNISDFSRYFLLLIKYLKPCTTNPYINLTLIQFSGTQLGS